MSFNFDTSAIFCDSTYSEHLTQQVIDTSIDQWHASLKASMHDDAGHSEHML